MATQAAIGRSVVVGVTISGIGSRRIASPAIVVGADRHRRSDQRNGDQRRRRGVLVPHHFRTLIELHAPPAEFFGQVLLERWILALQVRSTERRLID